jgi:hypothetical protein
MSIECIYCKGLFKSSGGLTNHISRCAVKLENEKQTEIALQVKCPKCGGIYKNQKGLNTHLIKCQAGVSLAASVTPAACVNVTPAAATTLDCHKCRKSYKTQKGLDNHLLSCDNALTAPVTLPQANITELSTLQSAIQAAELRALLAAKQASIEIASLQAAAAKEAAAQQAARDAAAASAKEAAAAEAAKEAAEAAAAAAKEQAVREAAVREAAVREAAVREAAVREAAVREAAVREAAAAAAVASAAVSPPTTANSSRVATLTVKCDYCDKTYKTRSGLITHLTKCIAKLESDRLAAQVICPYCAGVYKNSRGLSVHMLKCKLRTMAGERCDSVASCDDFHGSLTDSSQTLRELSASESIDSREPSVGDDGNAVSADDAMGNAAAVSSSFLGFW